MDRNVGFGKFESVLVGFQLLLCGFGCFKDVLVTFGCLGWPKPKQKNPYPTTIIFIVSVILFGSFCYNWS